MAYSFENNTKKSISLEEFIEVLDKKFNPDQPETLMDCSEEFQQLSNNDTFLIDYLHNALRDISSFQESNSYTSQSLILYSCKNYYIRANIWQPISEKKEIRKWQTEMYEVLRVHDHNFNFLTVGYFGSGYNTEIWEYDYEKINCIVGEKVEMNFLEKTNLPKGKIMYYRASKDIHFQHPAEEYSISLNVIPTDIRQFKKEQLFFNLNSKTIAGIAPNRGTGRHFVAKLAGIYGNTETIQNLEALSKNHELPFVRLSCFEALAKLTNDPALIWKEASKDNNNIVSENAKTKLINV